MDIYFFNSRYIIDLLTLYLRKGYINFQFTMIIDSFSPCSRRCINFQFTMIMDLFTSHLRGGCILFQFTIHNWFIHPLLKGGYNFLIHVDNWFTHLPTKKRGMSKSIIKKNLIINDNKLYSILTRSARYIIYF